MIDPGPTMTKYGPARLPWHYTPRIVPVSMGSQFIDFTETFCTVSRAPKGQLVGDNLQLTAWQKWLFDSMFEVDFTGRWRYRQCIVGLPRKNGKSLLAATIAICVLFHGTRGTEVYSAASTRDQAKIVFEEAKRQIQGSPDLMKRLKIYRDHISNRVTGATYRPLAADADSAQGLGPKLVIMDEVHALQPSTAKAFWNSFAAATGDQPESMIIGITTAGADKETTLLGGLYKQGIKAKEDPASDRQFGMFWWELPEEADITDPSLWPIANPNLEEGLFEISEIERQLKSDTMLGTLGAFKRFYMNQWFRADGQDAFILENLWKKAVNPALPEHIPKGSKITLGFDGSIDDDSSGFVACDVQTGLIELLAGWDRPVEPDPNWMVDREEVNYALHRIFREYDVELMFADRKYFETDIESWRRDYRGKIMVTPQTLERMIPANSQLKLDLNSGNAFVSEADPRLKAHFLNAVISPIGKVSKDGPMSMNKVDYLIAASLANSARNRVLRRSEPVLNSDAEIIILD